LALDGGKWTSSRPGRFTPGLVTPGTLSIGGWVGLRAGLALAVNRTPVVHIERI